jgi:hypothetical protein
MLKSFKSLMMLRLVWAFLWMPLVLTTQVHPASGDALNAFDPNRSPKLSYV